MAQECRGHYILNGSDLKRSCDQVHAILSKAGFKAYRRRAADDGFTVAGTRGSSIVAILGSFIPFNDLLGFLTRVRATVTARPSLNEGDDTLHLYVRVWPIDELYDQREQWLYTQGVGERLGDSFQIRRVFHRIVKGLALAKLIRPR